MAFSIGINGSQRRRSWQIHCRVDGGKFTLARISGNLVRRCEGSGPFWRRKMEPESVCTGCNERSNPFNSGIWFRQPTKPESGTRTFPVRNDRRRQVGHYRRPVAQIGHRFGFRLIVAEVIVNPNGYYAIEKVYEPQIFSAEKLAKRNAAPTESR
jgi:hypothetical protein